MQIGDQDGVGDPVKLQGPVAIIRDVLQPERLLFTDQLVGKIKSFNLTNSAVLTEYTDVGELGALAQNSVTGELYFTSQAINSFDINIYQLPGDNLQTPAQLVGTLRHNLADFTTFQFTNMVLIHNATKLVVFLPSSKTAADVELFDITTTPPRKLVCDLGIEGIQYYDHDGATGLLLDTDDTL